ncbi:hypothetical protein [Streptomyces sp. VRA16 Mangrove soil]|uniref:hypothetical protein n=1 Tax=Streptomyces sp. VRA16 Mangrove soil TaxID=2817434 RepID=UPI001A9D6CBA|nr:hypothetical protein [Streptomyces sp. VRA16 Mangrove soil]MBO1335245.1 hypothetical protein [Streptomyces sp. VRA16 Mangrove soil]
MTTYWGELSELLRARGLPDDHVTATIADLAAHAAESGATDPADEFGPAGEFARHLAPEPAAADGPPDEHVETWRWTADTYADEALLDRFGDEGWEVERIDALGRFVSHRDPENPQRWEYRRELVTRGRAAVDAKLAPEGWEPCGTWVVYGWYKRPRAATLGPAARLASTPPVPARSTFLSRRFYVTVAVAVLALVTVGLLMAVSEGDASTGAGFITGALAGAIVPILLIWLVKVVGDRRR